MRRISLRNKTHAFVTYITPASSQRGTEISFKIRVDTPPGTPIESQAPEKETAHKRQGAAREGENDTVSAEDDGEERESPAWSNTEEQKVPDTTGKSQNEENEDRAAVSGKSKGGNSRAKTRVRNG